jgi:hypothetical protein
VGPLGPVGPVVPPPPEGLWTQSISTSIVPQTAEGFPNGAPDGYVAGA